MNKTTHIIAGVTAGVAVNKFVVPTLTNVASAEGFVGIGAVMAGAFIGSVLPDIDHPGSFIGRKVKPISIILNRTVGHRGMTHAPIFVLGLSALLGFLVMKLTGFTQAISLFFVLGLFAGMVSHLLMDMLTKSGIPLLYPFSKKDFSIAPFKTGGIGEYIASLACILIIFFMMKEVALVAFVE